MSKYLDAYDYNTIHEQAGYVIKNRKHIKRSAIERYLKYFDEKCALSKRQAEDAKKVMSLMRQDYPDGTLVKLAFVGERTEQPVLASLIREYPVDVSILQGNISQTRGGAYGTMILQITGEAEATAEAIQYLHEQGVQTEVFEK